MTESTKIAFIITGLNTGGAEMMLFKLLERLSPEFTPQVISLTDIGAIGQRIQSLGIPVFHLGMNGKLPNPLALIHLIGILKRIKPNIVSTWMYHADFLGGLAARMAGLSKVIWSIHCSQLDITSKLTTRLLVKVCARLSGIVPEQIHSCSLVARDIHISSGYDRTKFLVIPNGFDTTKFRPNPLAKDSVRQELGISCDTPLVGMLARFDPQKNHIGFVEAAGYLHEKRPDVHFLLAGADIDDHNLILSKAIKKAKINDVTHLLGSRQDIYRIMSSLDVLASSSYGEAFPNVIGEAMSCGVPCAVTDVGDSAYIVGDTGKVVFSGNMIGLADAMDSLLSLSSFDRAKLGEKARYRIEENFEISHIVNLYESAYRKL